MTDVELIEKFVPLDKQKLAKERLLKGEPVQYIIGNVEFYVSIINVNPNVLIPRFETEYLIDKTLKLLKDLNFSNPNVLEIGTGSGCISIALKKNINCQIEAIDISGEALSVAKENAIMNKVDINFQNIDIHDFYSEEKYDLIISNPPYVPYNSVVDEKIKYEPEVAIYAPQDGIYFYDIILNKIKNNLKKDYLIAFEIGDNEGLLIKEIVNKYLPQANFYLEKDYNNYERYIFITNKLL